MLISLTTPASAAASSLLLPCRLRLLCILPLGIPLSRLQHQHTYKHERQYRITGSHDLQSIVPSQRPLLSRQHALHADSQLPLHEFSIVFPARDDPHALDNVGNVYDDTADVEGEAGAVEKHVRLAGFVELDEETEEAGRDDDVEDPCDNRGRVVQEAEVVFEVVEGFGGAGCCGPEDGVIVGEEGEADAEEE